MTIEDYDIFIRAQKSLASEFLYRLLTDWRDDLGL